MIDWFAFLIVAISALIGALLVVALFSTGVRLLAVSGRVPHVPPATFTDAITIMTAKEAKSHAKKARKAAERSPLSETQKRSAFAGAWACFVLSGIAVLWGIYLIVPALHS